MGAAFCSTALDSLVLCLCTSVLRTSLQRLLTMYIYTCLKSCGYGLSVYNSVLYASLLGKPIYFS